MPTVYSRIQFNSRINRFGPSPNLTTCLFVYGLSVCLLWKYFKSLFKYPYNNIDVASWKGKPKTFTICLFSSLGKVS